MFWYTLLSDVDGIRTYEFDNPDTGLSKIVTYDSNTGDFDLGEIDLMWPAQDARIRWVILGKKDLEIGKKYMMAFG